ncbi:MAG TPA: type II toxin-antitoxin system RelE/ParE family toxin [Geminicoccaceae bacterium]|nr:type II toxin-antitoxin system RelE/ParE family toxin [Geminicoccaceae bacterium]
MNAPSPQFTVRAARELRAIRRWIAAESGISTADQLIDRVMTAARLLAEHPQIGRERPELSPGLRSFPVWPYVIFYRPIGGGARILRIVHGHQDLEWVFGGRR